MYRSCDPVSIPTSFPPVGNLERVPVDHMQDLARHAEVGMNSANRFEAGEDERMISVERCGRPLDRQAWC